MGHVFFVNGYPKAGKDEFVNKATKQLMGLGAAVLAFSSIDPVRNMLREWGFNVDRKTEAERALMAEVGAALEKYNGFRTSRCAHDSYKFLRENESGVVFIHMREPENIHRTANILADLMPEAIVKTVIVDRDKAERVTSNAADAGVENMSYDVRIDNNGTLEDLMKQCEIFAQNIVHGGTL